MINRKNTNYFFLAIAILNVFIQLYGNSKNVWSCIGAGFLLISAIIQIVYDRKKNEK